MSTRLESSTNEFLSTLEKSAADLDIIADRLEEEFASRYLDGINPFYLVAKLRKMQLELPTVTQECRELLAEKAMLADKLTRLLDQNVQSLSRLEQRAGVVSEAVRLEQVSMLQDAVLELKKRHQDASAQE